MSVKEVSELFHELAVKFRKLLGKAERECEGKKRLIFKEIKCPICGKTLLTKEQVKKHVESLDRLRKLSRTTAYTGIFPKYCERDRKTLTVRIEVNERGYSSKVHDNS